MNPTLSAAMRFKWRCIAYFFGTLFATLGSALSTSTAETSWRAWAIAGILALGSAFGALKALLDQTVEINEPETKTP